ncbi:hypothetical protein KHM83_13250 [Fusibacter paucivorans]|uniref:Uncharacterized protein n=1 Tax=Fusibacter paucivorans TaxID=76009 RepID=A0ABS5PTG8_9FIRM|nr:4Fe-4S cluster-binding domain-containing protein [Fusibacter paucivorans]MBS7527646.1 hypothetical protein [Fusibacter paucivorans]
MEIRYKGIVHNILNDAPFIGAVIIANGCSMPCPDCINEHLKDDSLTMMASPEAIIRSVRRNGLNQGIILSGLEWTEQSGEMIALVQAALAAKLEVIIYTHHDEAAFFKIAPELAKLPIYVKFGLYDAALKSDNHYSHTVKLATTNQYIRYLGSADD